VAELATGAVDDDARQDENHANDAEQVGGVLQAEPVVAGVIGGHQVNGNVADRSHHHQQQPGSAHCRQVTGFVQHSLCALYR
jgi:hypothetical protein